MKMLAKTMRRAAVITCLVLGATSATAQGDYPSKPIRLVVPFPAGNTADIVGRLLAERLHVGLGQPVIVENKAGAGGILGVDAVAKAEKDGHTLLLTTASPIVVNPAVYRSLPYNVQRDLAPIAAISYQPMILLANKSVPATNLKDLVQYLSRNSDKAAYASVGAGTFGHLAMETFVNAVGVRPTHVPYKGSGAAYIDVMSGQVAMMFDGLSSGSAQYRAGRLNALAVTSSHRSPLLPDVPTVAESGIPALKNFEVSAWVGLFAPAGTSSSAIRKIRQEIDKILGTSEFRSQLLTVSMTTAEPRPTEQFVEEIRLDTAKWSQAARDAKLSPFE